MIRPDQIPDEVVEAAAKALMDPDFPNSWTAWTDEARAAIAAALSVWPGAWAVPMYSDPKTMLHLPLPQKDGDE